MTTLLVQPLRESLEQAFTLNYNKRYVIGCISPYIYIQNNPNGIFTLKVEKNNSVIFTDTFTSQNVLDSIETVNESAHVFYPVLTDGLYLEKGNFKVVLESNYSSSDSSFIGWIQQFENTQNSLDYAAVSDDRLPLATRIKIYERGYL